MKKNVLALTFCFSLGCVNIAHADFLGIGRAWENVKREVTNVAQPVEKATGKAWEDVKRESTNVAHNSEKAVGTAWEDIKREASTKEAEIIGSVALAGAAVAGGNYGTAVEIIKDIARVI